MSELPRSISQNALMAANNTVLESGKDKEDGVMVDNAEISSPDSMDGTSSSTSSSLPVHEVVLDPSSPRSICLRNIEKMEDKFELGYDSDGEAGPWCDMERYEGEQDSMRMM